MSHYSSRLIKVVLPLLLLLNAFVFTAKLSALGAACPLFPYTVPASDVASLINAMNCANSNGAGTNDTINLTNSTYTLLFVNASSTGLPPVVSVATSGTLTINGNGATIARSAVGGTPEFRLVYVNIGANLTLNRVTLTNGRYTAPGDGGGAIRNDGTLLLNQSTVSLSSASVGGGILSTNASSLVVLGSTLTGNAALTGGGIANRGSTLKIINSTLFNNSATDSAATSGGGAIEIGLSTSVTQIINSTIAGNNAFTSSKSGIYQKDGTLTVQNTIVANNTGGGNCAFVGGTFTDGGNNLESAATCGFGGAVGQGVNPLLGSLASNGGPTQTMALLPGSPAINRGSNAKAVDQNGSALTTDQRGAGFNRIFGALVDVGAYEFSCAITFPHTVAADDSADLVNAVACANANGPGTNDVINLTDSTYTLNAANSFSTALPTIADVAIAGTLRINGSEATIARSSAGGTPEFRLLYVLPGGDLTLNRVTLTNGLLTTPGAAGGAIINSGTLLLSESTISLSSAPVGGGVATATDSILYVVGSTLTGNAALTGGGIAVRNGVASIVNSTLNNNSATDSGATSGGGAIDVALPGSEVQVTNSTIAGNNAFTASRGGIYVKAGGLFIQNSIVANNGGGAGNCAAAPGFIIDGGNNLENSTSCGFGGAVGQNTNPQLSALANNGGPTQTMAISRVSPAVNAGSNGKAVDQNGSPLTTDQRSTGFPRISAGTVDIGAYEVSPVLRVQLTLQGRATAAPSPAYVVTVHVKMLPLGGGAPLFTGDFVSDDTGLFFVPGLPSGAYTFYFKGTHTLARQYNITLSNAGNSTTTPILLEGDANDDNTTTITDFSILASSFGKAQGQVGYDSRADFTGDNAVTLPDFSLLATNFGQAGEG